MRIKTDADLSISVEPSAASRPKDAHLVPGRCYRRGLQIIRVIGPIFPTVSPQAECNLWYEVSQEEWEAAVARAKGRRRAGGDGVG